MANQQNFSIPLAIIVAGFVIAIAVVFAKSDTALKPETESKIDIKLNADDHIRGNPDAKITIIEFSDLECPFCKRFHPTMQQVINDYQEVKWIYRHFPLDSLHSKARQEAEATECAGEQGKFWEYVDRLFEVTPSNNGLDASLLPRIAQDIGLNISDFNFCLASGKYKDKVQDHYSQAVKAGGQGTPYSVIIGPGGEIQAVSGAVGYPALSGIIDDILQ